MNLSPYRRFGKQEKIEIGNKTQKKHTDKPNWVSRRQSINHNTIAHNIEKTQFLGSEGPYIWAYIPFIGHSYRRTQ